jgi:hypothetical protein
MAFLSLATVKNHEVPMHQNAAVLCIALLTSAAPAARPVDDRAPRDEPLPASALEGTWSGESVCQVPGSPCRDEKAVYRVQRSTKNGKVPIDGGRLVNGKVVSMGVLEFDYDPRAQTLTCEYKQGVLRFAIKGDDMTGTLTTPDGVVYRRISLRKQAK